MTPDGRAILAARIGQEEGDEHQIYLDQFGNPTIGRGHLCTPDEVTKYAGGISEAEDDALLDGDLDGATDHVETTFPWAAGLDPVREGVVIDMAFQLGIGHPGGAAGLCGFPSMTAACAAGEHEEVAGAGSDMLAALEAEDFNEAADQMLNSLWHKQTPARCERLARIMRSGVP